MLRDLTRRDWLAILGLSAELVPQALIVRGTRNLKSHYENYRRLFSDVHEVGTPNGLIEDVLIGNLGGRRVAYASVYGGPMAAEIVHLFGMLGTSLVVQIGCCGALGAALTPGDLFLAEEAYCGDGASFYYKSDGKIVRAAPAPAELNAVRAHPEALQLGRIYSTAALFAEGKKEIEDWHAQGYGAVDMETAATFAVAEHFGMERLSLLLVFDNPRHSGHLLLAETDKAERRAVGNRRMNDLALAIIKERIGVK